VAALAVYGVGSGPALAYALGLQALQLTVAIVAGLAALAGHGLTLGELAGRSRQAAAALNHAEPRVPAAEGPAAGG
jgi:VIT1/CCC1 family predicted Fe2+/Mn2+ transporter